MSRCSIRAPREAGPSAARVVVCSLALGIAGVCASGQAAVAATEPGALRVHAVDRGFVDSYGRPVGHEHVGRRLRVMNVDEVRDVELVLAAIETVATKAGKQRVFQIEASPPETGPAASICKQRGDGSTWLIPLSGRWTPNGELRRRGQGATLACASGAIAKCMEWGFLPWTGAVEFQACTRMVRADYCGNGESHTRPGIHIAFDRAGEPELLGRQSPGLRFEALWGADGARCVESTRVRDLFSLGELLAQCPDRVAASWQFPGCDDGARRFLRGAVFINHVVDAVPQRPVFVAPRSWTTNYP